MRLELDHNRLIQDLEMTRNGRIKELKRHVSELQAASIKLGEQQQQLEQTLTSGSEVEVIGECVGDTTRLDLLALIEEPTDYAQPIFTRSDLLQQADNLVGQFTTGLHRPTSKSNTFVAICTTSASKISSNTVTYFGLSMPNI